MATMTTTQDWSLYSIPAAFLLALAPVFWAECRLWWAFNGPLSNVSPRDLLEGLKGKIPQDVYDACHRARCAHFNSLEAFPLFAAAVLAGRMMGVPKDALNSMSLQYLGTRVLYTVLFINTTRQTPSYLRSIVWMYNLYLPIRSLFSAASLGN